MAHHKSCKKRVRQSAKIRDRNRWYTKTMRNAVRDIRKMDTKTEAQKKLNETFSLIDKVAKRNQIHKNKAANLKSSLAKYVNNL